MRSVQEAVKALGLVAGQPGAHRVSVQPNFSATSSLF
jgi:hypothetical protein